jgi:hypothetical protein
VHVLADSQEEGATGWFGERRQRDASLFWDNTLQARWIAQAPRLNIVCAVSQATIGGVMSTSGDVSREQQEARVIDRRRRLEEERKARIFNAKQRTIGIDKYASPAAPHCAQNCPAHLNARLESRTLLLLLRVSRD